jgi:hypothetical protein
MDPTVGPIEIGILLFIAFVVPFLVIVLDNRASHQP